MIDAVDQRMKAWVSEVIGEISVSLLPPARSQGKSVGLYLLELRDRPPLRGGSRAPLQFALRYLVTSNAEDPEEAHRALGQLLFAAMENPDFELEQTPVAMEVWRAFGVPPQPSFTLLVPIQQERPERRAPLVRQPLVTKLSPAVTLHGIVLGPGDIPLPDVKVMLPSLRLTSRTDAKGRFQFHGIPQEIEIQKLEVQVKGRARSIPANQIRGEAGEPWVIHFNSLEE